MKPYYLPAILLLVAGLGGPAQAQLLHRYDFNSTNDTVGTANGTLVGSATLSGGALVTTGSNGLVNGTWSGTGPRMTLSTNAVAGITNAFTIESWFSCSTGWPKYDTLYAFSDSTTANFLLGVPVNGYGPWPSGVNIAGGGGSNEAHVFGIYLDDSNLHQTVLTYDGTMFTYYVDGLLANFSGMSATATDPGFNLSRLNYIGINGGSPWADPSLTGSTFDFRIYGQALSPAQIATIFALGSDASYSSISNALRPPTAFTWNGAGANNNWSTGLNWAGGAAPAATGTSLTFAGSTRTTPNLDANYSINGLVFSNNAGSFTIGTDNSSTLTLAGNLINNSANAQTLNVPVSLDVLSTFSASTGNLTLRGAISGAGSVTKTGNGVLALSTANTISGNTTVSAGAVRLGDANALQSSTVVLQAPNGLTFNAGIGTFNVGGLSGTNGTSLADTGSSAVTLSVGANNVGTTFGGALAGTGGALIKVGSGTLTLNGASTYTGGTTVSGGILAAQDAVAPGLVTPFGTGPVTVNNGSVLELGFAPNNAFGSYSISNSVTLDNGSLFAFDASHRVTGNLTIAGGGAVIGSTFDAPWEVFAEANFPKALFIDGLVTGSGNLTVQQTGWAVGNAWNTSCAVFTSQGSAAQNTYSGAVTINPMAAGNGGSYLYLAGPNVFANASLTLSGDNDPATARMGVSTLLFGNGSLDGPGHATLGGLAGNGSLLLADTILFSGGSGYSNGAPVALTVGNDNTSTTYSGVMSGAGSLIKVGAGTLALNGVNTYTGDTTITGGSLALGGAWLSSSNVTVAAGTTLDVSALGSITMNGNQALLCGGTVSGTVNVSAGSKIYAGTDGGYGTNAITGDLTLAAGAIAYLDVGTSAGGPNDRFTVAGTLTANGNIIHLKAPSGLVNLDAATDYVLFSSPTIVGSFASAPAWDAAPANAGHYRIVTGPTTVTLHYLASSGPSGVGSVLPAPAVRNQNVAITVTAANGIPGTVNSVMVDTSPVGGSSTLALVAAGGNVWTNSVAVTPDTPAGAKTLAVTISDTTSLTAIINLPLTVMVGNDVWNGAGGDNNLGSNLNWTNKTAPGYVGDSLEFAGGTRLNPNVDNNYTLTGITFDSGAGSFNLASGNGSALTLTANGIVNNSANAQTLNVPISLGGPQKFNAAAGNLTLGQSVTKGGNLVIVAGAANTAINAPISDSGSLFKQGVGALTISADSSWDLTEATSGGFSGPLIAQSGTLIFNNGSTHTVSGELVIGGVVTNGGAGNNASIVVDNAALNVSSWLSVGRGNGLGTVSSALVLTNNATVTAQNFSAGYNGGNSANRPKGSVSLNNASSLSVSGGAVIIGESDGSDMTMNVNDTATLTATGATLDVGANNGKGTLNINGGSVAVNSVRVGRGANNTNTAQGTITLNSGTLSSESDVVLGFAGNGAAGDYGKLVINGGTVNFATTTVRWLMLNQWDTASGQLEVNGGQLNINGNSAIVFSPGNGSSQATNVINLNGGAITFYSDNATTVGGTGQLDLQRSGGAASSATVNLSGGVLTVPQVMSTVTSGSQVFNFNGGTLKPTASTATFMQGLTAANVKPGGAIIDTAGSDITIAQPLLNAGGGLTKLGAGTLTLSGANTYAKNTTVSGGTLALTQPTLSAVGTVTVADGAMLQLGFSGANQVAGLVLNGVSQVPGVYNAATSPSFLSGTGSLVVPPPVNPQPPRMQMAVSGSILTLAWPTNAGWILQVQTNNLATGLSTNWLDVPASALVTSTNITVNPALPTEFFRLRHP